MDKIKDIKNYDKIEKILGEEKLVTVADEIEEILNLHNRLSKLEKRLQTLPDCEEGDECWNYQFDIKVEINEIKSDISEILDRDIDDIKLFLDHKPINKNERDIIDEYIDLYEKDELIGL